MRGAKHVQMVVIVSEMNFMNRLLLHIYAETKARFLFARISTSSVVRAARNETDFVVPVAIDAMFSK